MFKFKNYLPFIGNLIIISISFKVLILTYDFLQAYFPESAYLMTAGFSVILYFAISRLYANTIFKHIVYFNICKSEQKSSESNRETQALTLKDVQLFLLEHRKNFIYANLFLLPLTLIIFVAFVFGFDLTGQAVETANHINPQNIDREFTDLELMSIFIPAEQSAQNYYIYSFMITYLIAAYFTTKRMFSCKKIYKQFYLVGK